LYFVSPIISEALNSGEVMKNPAYRFMAVEHISTMLLAIILIQVGRSLSKKATDAVVKHKRALIFFSIGMLLILSRIPWNAPLFRF
jgi:predicted Na+-dependent transporter